MSQIKPLTKRQQRSLETREKIYNTAIELIKNHGYENVTINDICEKAKVSVGSLYHQFSSKDEILVSCSESEDRIIGSMVKKLSKKDSHSLRYKELFMKRVSLGSVEKTVDFTISCSIAHLSNRINATYSIERELYKALLNEIVEGQKNGEFSKDVDPNFFVESSLYYITGLCHAWQVSKGILDVEVKAAQQVDFLLRTITV